MSVPRRAVVRRTSPRWAAGLLTLAALCAMPAHAGLFDDDEARRAILDLRQRLDALRQSSDAANQRLTEDLREDLRRAVEENAPLRRSLIELQNQIDSLNAEVAKLRGQDEQRARQLQQQAAELADLQRRQKDIAQGVDDRLRRFEPIKVTVDGREFNADPAEKTAFDNALAIFRRSDFPAAQSALVDFVRRYPQSGYVPSALFWLGNAQYATRDYKEAVINFRSLLLQSPDHMRAPEAVLSIANCQIELKDPRAAKKTLEVLVKAYPQSEAAVAARDRLTRMR
ncbi:MAG: tol-pal system protein YbgF [Burkholderiaceae bacterium]|nr:tol-pal system protein YbgF [Burkholderiaceae bacterium]